MAETKSNAGQSGGRFPFQLHFSRGLSPWQAGARGLGVILSATFFSLLGHATTAVGPLTPLALLLAGLLITANSLGYAELAVVGRRSGGAYALIHEERRSAWLAFAAGWSLTLAGLGLCGLLVRAAAHHLNNLLGNLLGVHLPISLLGSGLVVLGVVGSSLGWRAGRRIPFTFLLLVLVVALAAAVALVRPTITYPTPALPLGYGLGFFTAAFVGLEAIADHRGEIRRPSVDLPRTLLGTPLLAGVVGALLTIPLAPLAAGEAGAPLAAAGEIVAGVTGRMLVLAVGTIAPFLAFSRALTTVVRLLYRMSHDGYWPSWLGRIQGKRGVPLWIILLAGSLVLSTLHLPTDAVASVSGLLYLLVLMAVNLTLAGRARRRTRSRFTLPFHPWIPALTVAVDVLVIPLWRWEPILIAAGALVVGGLAYLAYGRRHHLAVQQAITVVRSTERTSTPADFRILVPVANPETENALLRLAGQLARARGGEVLALHVVVVPESLPLEVGRSRAESGRLLLEQAVRLAEKEGLPIQTMSRVARSAAQGIVDAASEEEVDLILMGGGRPSRGRPTLGTVVDTVLRDAPCDVLVMHGGEIGPVERILVPTAGGFHARAAARIAFSLAEIFDAEVTLLCVQTGPRTQQQAERAQCQIEQTLEGLSPSRPPEKRVVTAPDVAEAIVWEAQAYDLVLMGVSEESLLDRILFGDVPLQVAAQVPTVVLVQGARGLTGVWTRRVVRALSAALPVLSVEEQAHLYRDLMDEARPGTDYFALIVLSSIIAALGLLLDSPAVVIGAMLVAPLMSPLLAFSLGLVLGDLRMIRFSVEAVFKGTALALLIGVLIGFISPLREVTDEMLARAQPNLLDMGVALASGAAGAYALARKDVSAALPGVAIAAALMPPLATVGLGLALGNAGVAGGAFLLFVTNIAAIGLAGGILFLLLGIRPRIWGPEPRRRLRKRLAVSSLLLAAIAVPLCLLMVGTLQDAAQEQTIRQVLAERFSPNEVQIVDVSTRQESTGLAVEVTLRATHPLDRAAVEDLADVLSERLERPVNLAVTVLPTINAWGR